MFRCNTCEALFKDELLLNIHEEIEHNIDVIEIDRNEEQLEAIDHILAQHEFSRTIGKDPTYNMFRCNTCAALFKDALLLAIHEEIEHNRVGIEIDQNEEEQLEAIDQMLAHHQVSRPSVIHYAPAPPVEVELHAHALPGSVVTHFKIDNAKLKLEEFMKSAKRLVVNTLQSELKRLNFIKFGLLLDATFTNTQNEISPRGFLTKNRTAMFSTDIEQVVSECFEELLTKLQEHEGRGSGWES